MFKSLRFLLELKDYYYAQYIENICRDLRLVANIFYTNSDGEKL